MHFNLSHSGFAVRSSLLIVQYRKYGYFNKFRGFLLYLFLLYMMNAVYLVLLPFASRHNPR